MLKQANRLLVGLQKKNVVPDESKLIFYHGPTLDDRKTYDLQDITNIFSHPAFQRDFKTLIYIHGYTESTESISVNTVFDAYLRRADHNLLLFDWSTLAAGHYVFDCLSNLKKIGTRLGETILAMITAGLPLAKLHVVGHSLGAQLAGYAGRSIYKISRGTIKLARITALDSAFPGFFPQIFMTALNKADADMVDAIHTDSWLYGDPFCCGTVDFWPNGGRTLQPGCPTRPYALLDKDDLCSHHRSWKFWADAVVSKYSFLAVKAKSWHDYKTNRRLNRTQYIPMGIACPRDAVGNYYLQTNDRPPYGRGAAGLTYQRLYWNE